ncbi:MAG: hypothetical protein A4E53_01728 [Pelotomaculum sp. PtaB.Bin104]|nr:MAG: hypothetical protein A4E53_01728 [Pelotomaculum sp. PtaB.Bin104]
MAITISQVNQETDISGTITSAIASTGTTTFTAVLKDSKTGVVRTPQSTTLLWDIDKDNSSHEQILMTSHSTSGGITTFTINTVTGRNIPKYGTGNGSNTGLSHVVGASIGCVSTARPLNILANEAAAKAGDTLTGPLTGPVYADATARDVALPTPSNGMSAYLTAEGKWTDYVAGAWADRASGTNPNASTTVAGKVEVATQTEIDADTGTGGTGAVLSIDPATLVTSKYGTRLPSAAEKTYLTNLESSGTTVAEIDQALDGISANVTATNLDTLTASTTSLADALHMHQGLVPAPIGYYACSGVPMNAYGVVNYTAGVWGASSFESSDNGYALLYNTASTIVIHPGMTDCIFQCRGMWTTSSGTGFDTMGYSFGIDADTTNFTSGAGHNEHGIGNCIMFSIDGSNGHIYSKVWDGTTFTNTDLSTTLLKNTYATFRIEKTSSYIKFYVNGSLKTTQTTNIPGTFATWFAGTGKKEMTATANNNGTTINNMCLFYKTA